MKVAVIVDAVRTPIGRYGGALKDVRSDNLARYVIEALLQRNSIPQEDIEDVYMGCANQSGEDNRNVARMAGLLAGLPIEVAGVTVNRLCGSGLEAVNQAAKSILAEDGDLFVAGGTESMTRAPYVLSKSDISFGRDVQLADTTIGWRFVNPDLDQMYPVISLIETADKVAQKYHISREDQDRFAFESQQKTAEAMRNERFKNEIIPVQVKTKKETFLVEKDEHPRPKATLDKLSSLKSIYDGGTVTAGNASGVNDGAAALLMMSEEKAQVLGLKPLAKIRSRAVAGVDPSYMGMGPVPATLKALKRAGITVDQLDLVELNEAFAAQSLACIRELGIPLEKVNVNGGAIALGHPLGCSGARILTTLVHEMMKRDCQFGLASMCIGVGQGIATVIEKYEN